MRRNGLRTSLGMPLVAPDCLPALAFDGRWTSLAGVSAEDYGAAFVGCEEAEGCFWVNGRCGG